jgi:hypothetical protein
MPETVSLGDTENESQKGDTAMYNWYMYSLLTRELDGGPIPTPGVGRHGDGSFIVCRFIGNGFRRTVAVRLNGCFGNSTSIQGLEDEVLELKTAIEGLIKLRQDRDK